MRFKWNRFLTPFSPTLWFVVVGSVVLASVLLMSSFRIARRHGVEGADMNWLHEFGMFGSVFCVHGLFCSQGTSVIPRSSSCRLVLLAVGMASVVLLAAYSGALTSFIAVLQLALPHDTIEEYIDDRRFELAMTANAIWLYLHDPHSRLYEKLHEIMFHSRHSYPKNRRLGLKKLCSSSTPYGWFASTLMEAELLSSLGCEITPVPNHLVVDTLSSVVLKGSPYRQLFNHKISSMRTAGVLSYLIRQTWPTREAPGDNAQPEVELYHVVPILGVLVLGALASVLMVTVERLVVGRTRLPWPSKERKY